MGVNILGKSRDFRREMLEEVLHHEVTRTLKLRLNFGMRQMSFTI